MNFNDEKDYIMRIIKEMVRVLFSLMLGKQYVSVEQEAKNGYEVSGKKLDELLEMIDNGEINEAENLILDSIDYSNKNELATAALFYQYLSEKNEDFLQKNNYSKEEVLDGINQIMQKAGYNDVIKIMEILPQGDAHDCRRICDDTQRQALVNNHDALFILPVHFAFPLFSKVVCPLTGTDRPVSEQFQQRP